ncbi:hypothetical protein [Endozoicomonas sp. ALB032]|uniref:hypothetical protein n=1 Tax=Endozoicomonas sp. ALB032 TaxID=3403082 RepID=UPI003BB66D52
MKLLQQLEVPLESGQSNIVSVDLLLIDAAKLLNNNINSHRIAIYKRQQRSADHMLELIQEHGNEEPELVAWGNQFLKLIDVISLMLDPFDQSRYSHVETDIVNIKKYFRASGKTTTFYNYERKEKALFKKIEIWITLTFTSLGNLEPELFRKLLVHIKYYINQQLHRAFPDQNDYCVILEILIVGFKDLVFQSFELWELLPGTTIGLLPTFVSHDSEQVNETMDEAAKLQRKELRKRLRDKTAKLQKRDLIKRVYYLMKFTEWLDYLKKMRTSPQP